MSPFQGSITALITPFRGGKVDAGAFQKLVEWQIDQGTQGLVPCGTTGESPTLTHDEHKRVVELCIEAAAGRVPVIAGTGSNATAEAIELTRHAMTAGADAALVVTPYYNKPTQEGMYQHFKAVNDAIGLPIIIYSIPPRSVVDMSVETMARLYELKNIAGVKDATAKKLTKEITTAGAILIGENTPTALGDFTAGPSHVLPTGRTGRFFSGLRVADFMRRTSIVKYGPASVKKGNEVVAAFHRHARDEIQNRLLVRTFVP